MGLEAKIWASRLGGVGGAEEKEEKIAHMCESIGDRPLWGRSPNKVMKLILVIQRLAISQFNF